VPIGVILLLLRYQKKKPLPKYVQNIPGENGFFASYFDFTGLKQALAGASAVHTKKPTKTRLLASHAGNTDSCATANDYNCNDKTKKSYSKYSSDCDENTDTTDCGGMLAGSNCLAGECCCSKDAVAEGTDYSGYVTAAAPAWTESFATTDSYCYSSDCKTNFPVKCPTSYSCSGNKID